jgi:hypothetical protein
MNKQPANNHWVMDFETLCNCFVGVFKSINSEEIKIFVIHDLRNDLPDFIEFLKRNIEQKEWHVSYNGLAFDGQITQYIINNSQALLDMSGCEVGEWIYERAQFVISARSQGHFLEFSERDMLIHQVDLFKLNHWDNPAKRSSLKWIQYSMDWYNIQDMPIHHTKLITTLDEIEEIISYCINDVDSTKEIMIRSKSQIALRKTLTDEYNIPLFSASEPRISKELFLHFLSEKTGINKWDLKKSGTKRDKIVVKDIILDYINFKTATFQKLLDRFKEVIVYPDETKGGFKYSIQYNGVKTDFGLGGIHGAREKGVYVSDKENVILSSDVVSYYPRLAMVNQWSPAHIPKEAFCEQYQWFFDERRKISKKDIKNYVYKIILNSTYGLSNDKHSFLYDPEFTMRITINGQLSLCMLYEMIMERIPDAVPLLQNTDGLETMIPRKYVDEYMKICEEWQEMTKLELEHDKYKKIVLADVNNYIAVSAYKEFTEEAYNELKNSNPDDVFAQNDGKFYHASTKTKGMRFEYANLALHKNKSFLITRKALFNYFVHGINPEEFIKSQTNIFDFCGGVKIKGDWKFQKEQISNGDYSIEPLQETIRYYISNTGGKIIKVNKSDGRRSQVEAGRWLQTPFIKFEEKKFNEYDINYKYYLDKVNKIIQSIEPVNNQLKLEF